jgi:hypothetical protein
MVPLMQQNNKRGIDDVEEESRKRQRCSEEPTSAVQLVQSTLEGHSHTHTPADASNTPHNPTPVGCTLASACQPAKTTIPSKRPCPFGKDVPRKKRKRENYVVVRIYEQRKDLEHTNEIECALTPEGALELKGLSQKLKVKESQASQLSVVCGLGYAHCILKLKVLDPHSSRPWFSKRPILESGAIRLLKAKGGYLRVVCYPSSS